MKRETSAGGIVYRLVNGEPRFLVIRDSYGKWGFPKGHLERRERADTAALREVMEETGLRAVTLIGSIETIEWKFQFRGSLIHKRCHFFLMESATSVTKPQSAEGITACEWATFDEAAKLISYDNARGVLAHGQAMLSERLAARAS